MDKVVDERRSLRDIERWRFGCGRAVVGHMDHFVPPSIHLRLMFVVDGDGGTCSRMIFTSIIVCHRTGLHRIVTAGDGRATTQAESVWPIWRYWYMNGEE